MADYATTSVVTRYGEISDYSDNLLNHAMTYNSTTVTAMERYNITANTAGVTVKLTGFTTVECVALLNKSTTIDVEVRYTSLAPVTGSTANKMLLDHARPMMLPSATIANDIVLITLAGSAEVEVVIYGTLNT